MAERIETPSGRKRTPSEVLVKIPVVKDEEKRKLTTIPSKLPKKTEEESMAVKILKGAAVVVLSPLALLSLSGCSPSEEQKKDKPEEVDYVKPLPREEEISSQKSFENFFKDAFGVSYNSFGLYGVLRGWGYELRKNTTGGVTLAVGGKDILSFNHSFSSDVPAEVITHVPEQIAKGIIQIHGLVHLQNLLALGVASNADIKETEKFLEDLGKDYRRAVLLSELVIVNLPMEEYNLEHKNVENVSETLRDNENALYVREWDGAIANTSMEWLYTVQARGCSILILYDPKTETGAIAHISADEMTTKNTDAFIKKYIEILGGTIDDVQVYINFGWLAKDSEVILSPLKENGLLENVTETNLTFKLLGYDPPIFAWVPSKKKHPVTGGYVSVGEQGSTSIEDSAALYLPTGEIFYIRIEDKEKALPGGTIKGSEHNLGNPTVILE